MGDEGQAKNAEEVARTLYERELVLGTVECGTGGVVARRLFDAEDGPAVLSDSLRVDTIEEAIEALELPEAQFVSAGTFSAKAVRAAARQGRTFLGVDLCLAVFMLPPSSSATDARKTAYIALDNGQNLADRALHYEGARDTMAEWVAGEALALLSESLGGEMRRKGTLGRA